jgi:hypothetical protein
MANRSREIPRFRKTSIEMNWVIVSRYLGEKSNVIICKGSCSSECIPYFKALSGPFSETYHFSYSFSVFGIET